jgi:hypothetical protein
MEVNRVALGVLLAAMTAVSLAVTMAVLSSSAPATARAGPTAVAAVPPAPSPRPATAPAGPDLASGLSPPRVTAASVRPASSTPAVPAQPPARPPNAPATNALSPAAPRPSSATPAVAPAPARPVDPAQSAAAARPADPAGYRSGGLGLARPAWESLHGPGRDDVFGGVAYEGQTFWLIFVDDNVQRVERTWGDANAVSMDEARAEARRFGPADARLVRPTTSQGGTPGELLTSDSLKTRFGPEVWPGSEPGQFTVIYRQQPGSDRVTSIVVETGNNP